MTDHKQLTEAQWRERLTPEQYRILREGGTEPPFCGVFVKEARPGTYHCAGCGQALFSSEVKFDSGSGWPSFFEALDSGAIAERVDDSLGRRRIEVRCSTCDGHLGHVFEDASNTPTGRRYCINSAALQLQPAATGKEA